MITPSEIIDTITYDPDTGIITNRKTGKVLTGACLNIQGAKLVMENCIWAYHYGHFPSEDKIVDHKDRNRKNRKINNLRIADYHQNGYNMASRNQHAKGVTFEASRAKKWHAQIRINGRKVNLGRYYTLEEAAEAYKKAALEHHGEFACLD